jgi:hypothetical protein
MAGIFPIFFASFVDCTFFWPSVDCQDMPILVESHCSTDFAVRSGLLDSKLIDKPVLMTNTTKIYQNRFGHDCWRILGKYNGQKQAFVECPTEDQL